MNQFPAIAIGGPPHSGKSVLSHSLTLALLQQQIGHYLLRACPDGEGNWFNEAPQELGKKLRDKGEFTEQFVERICHDLSQRKLPFLVDVGGRPKPADGAILDLCTHAVLLVKKDVKLEEDSLERWRDLAQQHGLIIIAELYSSLGGSQQITAENPILQGTITGLERHTDATGPVFDALLQRVRAILEYEESELRKTHLNINIVPTELTIEVDRPIAGVNRAETRWQPDDLSDLLDYLPDDEPLSIYGRGPGWLSAAIALHIAPAPCYLFDPRLGWIAPPLLKMGKSSDSDPLACTVISQQEYHYLNAKIVADHLDYDEATNIYLPPLTGDKGLILSGKLPNWLITAMALHYQHHVPWIGIYQPAPLTKGIVIHAQSAYPGIGSLIEVPAADLQSMANVDIIDR